MSVVKLAHYSVRAVDLAASEKFYTQVLGFHVGHRPDFPFPGRWLYRSGEDTDCGMVHLIGADENEGCGLAGYLGAREVEDRSDTGALDHIAFFATDWCAMRGRLVQMKVDYVERVVPTLGLLQVFLRDPSGVAIELNYPAAEACR